MRGPASGDAGERDDLAHDLGVREFETRSVARRYGDGYIIVSPGHHSATYMYMPPGEKRRAPAAGCTLRRSCVVP